MGVVDKKLQADAAPHLTGEASPDGVDACSAGAAGDRKLALLGGHPMKSHSESFELQSAGAAGNATASCRVFVAATVACCCPMLFGIAIGFTSPAQISMLGTAKGKVTPILPPPELVVFTHGQFTIYAAIMTIGAIAGAFAGSQAMDSLGRKRSLALSACPHAIAWCGTVFLSDPWLLIGLRWLVGFAVGMGSAIAPSYLSEISTLRLRGPLGSTFQLVLNVGIFFVSAAGAYGPAMQEVDGALFCNWRRLSVWGAVFAAALSMMMFMPESPKWLAERGRLHEAKLALRKLRVGDTTAEEAELLAATEASMPSDTPSTASSDSGVSSSLLDYKMSLLVAVCLMAFQQLSGINPVMMYAADICAQAGMGNAEVSSMVIMGMQVTLTAASCFLVEAAGRRRMLQFATVTMCLSHVGLAYYMAAQSREWWTPSWLAMVCLCTYILGYCTGMGPVPWLMLGEIFPVEVRGAASALSTSVGWISAFVMLIQFRNLQVTLGSSGVFALFAVFCFGIFVFVCAVAPETQGKTVDQIVRELNSPAPRNAGQVAFKSGDVDRRNCVSV
mmetsp:Transcript_60503/g.174552  ORF Transcript_60503/g.174552 Transcript_60503/m.174552 type:complete len:559 (-) Transcript_60503:163-1839(-)